LAIGESTAGFFEISFGFEFFDSVSDGVASVLEVFNDVFEVDLPVVRFREDIDEYSGSFHGERGVVDNVFSDHDVGVMLIFDNAEDGIVFHSFLLYAWGWGGGEPLAWDPSPGSVGRI